MFKTIYKAIDFVANVFVLVVVIAYCQPSEAKPYPSMLALDKTSEAQVASVDTKHLIAFDFELNDQVVNIKLFATRILLVKGVISLHANDLKNFRVVFEYGDTDVKELADVINQLINDPRIYEE